jgi:hypothetical protein
LHFLFCIFLLRVLCDFVVNSHRRILAAVALVSFASLLLELALTRLFSVVLFYHFAFLAISIALLGLGAGGVFAYLGRDWLVRFTLAQIGAATGIINALVIVGVLEVVIHTPVALDLGARNFLRLTIIYLASAAPFFCTGVLLAVLFAREHRRAGALYGADLLGGAAACLAIVPLLNWIGGPNAVLAAACAMAMAAVLWSRIEIAESGNCGIAELETASARFRRDSANTQIRNYAMVVVALLAIAIVVNHNGRLVDIVYAKGQRRDQPWMLYAKWNAISRVEVNQVGESKYIVIDADASTAIMNVDPARWGQDVAAKPNAPAPNPNLARTSEAPLPQENTYNWRRDLMAAAPAVVNVLRPRGDYAIIGPGGGVDVLRAVANGSRNVTGIEINPIIATTIMRGLYADYAYHLYELPQVHLHVSDGRSFIRASHEKYDVIQMTLVDTWASTAAGAYALSENNLYTVEAFREYFDHLKPDGMIAITRWEFARPREALRVVSQALQAIPAHGLAGLIPNFIIVSDGDLNEDGRPVTVLAKKTPFTDEETSAVLRHVAENPNLHVVYAAGKSEQQIAALGARMASSCAAQPFAVLIGIFGVPGSGAFQWSAERFAAQYPYNISPVSDNAPFFFFTIRTRDVLRGVFAGSGKGMDWRINLGIVVLGIVLIVSIAAVLAFLVLPLAVHALRARVPKNDGARPPSAGPPARGRAGSISLIYFIALGLGYILIEIAFIQRFVLFLGHPTYALTVVVFLMLLASGAGSVAARRRLHEIRRVRLPLALAALLALAYIWLLPRLLTSLVGLPFIAKLALTAALLAPLGFVMGMPFPAGLAALGGDAEGSLVEWAWAMNAAASVLGSVLAMIIAIHFGLNVTLALGAGAYCMALVSSRALQTASA